MTTETRYPFARASKVADYILTLLKPHCNRIHIAGSIRRMRPDIKDIEIVCEPGREFVSDNCLFPEIGSSLVKKDFTESLMMISDAILIGNVEGRYMRIKTKSANCPGIYLDLFMPKREDYYRMLAIRTGSADYAHHVIAGAWKRKGWVGVKEQGLRLRSECDEHIDAQNKKTYTIKKELAAVTMPPVWESEGKFFTWLGLEYKDPEHREYNPTVNLTQ